MKSRLNTLIVIAISTSLSIYSTGVYALDAAQFIENIANVVNPFMRLVTGGAYVLGAGFIYKAFYHLKVYGEARTMMSTQTSLKQPMTYLLVAMVFLYLPTAMEVMLQTTFGSSNILAYSNWEGNSQYGGITMNAVFKIIQFIGVVAFIRGWLILAQGAGQQGQPQAFAKGLTHIFGGVLAVNIVGTANILSATLGVSFN